MESIRVFFSWLNYLAKLSYFANLGFPEIAGVPHSRNQLATC